MIISPTKLTIIDSYFMKIVMFWKKYENSSKCVTYLIALFFHKLKVFRRKSFPDAFNKI